MSDPRFPQSGDGAADVDDRSVHDSGRDAANGAATVAARRLPPHPRRHRSWGRTVFIIATIGTVFLLGGAVGSLVTGVIVVRTIRTMLVEPDRWEGVVVRRLNRRLDLTPNQRVEVGRIMRARLLALREIRADVYPRVTEQIDAMRAEIASTLDPDQLAIFDQYFNELEQEIRLPPPAEPVASP